MGHSQVRERLRAMSRVGPLLGALEGLPPTYLVGGAVRDLLRGERAIGDLDVAIEGDAALAAQELARRLGGHAKRHERFGTATLLAGDLALDLAQTRVERYERPGALPTVAPAPLAQDLARRDFAINAMAVALGGDALGRLHDPLGGVDDLERRVVRVLHERSFLDDPTRLLRAVRYETRLDFVLEADTERLVRAAAEDGALATVSGARVRDELLDLLAEHEAPRAVARLGDLGIDRALDPALVADGELVAGAGLGALETGADRVLAGLAALLEPDPLALAPLLDRLALPAPQRGAVIRAAGGAPAIARRLRSQPARPSELHGLLAGEPPETLALALALGAPPAPILDWTSRLRHVRLEIGGDDLVAAGYSPSPALGRALEQTLRRKLDGEVDGHAAELGAALEVLKAGPA
jgi:tRNA nucleotidyltransferase (CCA-adding enzyme)